MNHTSPRKDALVKAWTRAWDLGEVEALDDLLAPDYRRRTRSSESGQSRDELKAMITTTRMAFPDLVTVVDDVVEDGDRMAIRWHSTGRHTGRFLGVPPTGKSVTVTGATFARFASHVVVEEWVTWDPRELLTALGIITVGGDDA